MDGFAGVITAQSYYGDGSTLTGIGQTVNVVTSNLFVVGVSTLTGFTTTGSDLYVAGIATVGTGLTLADNVRAKFGNDGDLEIYHTGSESHIQEQGTGGLILNGSVVTIKNPGDTETIARFTENGGVDLNFDNSTKFATHNTGVKVTGIATISSDLNVAGITTVGILTAYESITVKVGAGSTELTTALSAKASTGKAIAMAMVFG